LDRAKSDTEAPRIPWNRFALIFAALFLLRGLLLLCVLPPFEGWDEYQHLAYIVHLDEQHELPKSGQSTVPTSLAPLLRQYPQPDWSVDQNRRWGTRNYSDFWNNVERTPIAPEELPPIKLYQAQHPPLYYYTVLPVWRMLGGRHPLAAIYVLRILNLLFVSLAIFTFALTTPIFISRMRYRLVLLLVLACHPLYLINAARIANDPLAILLGTVGVCLLLHACRKGGWRFLIPSAIMIGAGVLTKHTTLVLVPVWGIVFLLSLRKASDLRWRLISGGVGMALFCGMVGPDILVNYAKFGSITSAQETGVLREKGTTSSDMIRTAISVPWKKHFRKLILPGRLWVSGWSFLDLSKAWRNTHEHIMRLSQWALIAGLMIALWRRLRKRAPAIRVETRLFSSGSALVVSALVVLGMSAGMVYHTVLLRLAWGIAQTNPWYFMLAAPFWIALVLQAVLLLDHRALALFGVGLSAFHLVAEFNGIFRVMPAFFAATACPGFMWGRMGYLHPPFPHPAHRIVLLLAVVAVFAYIVRTILDCWREDFRRLACAFARGEQKALAR